MPANTTITIKEGTASIAGEAFQNCTGLTSITIPNSVTSIGQSAFSSCTGLTSITIPNSVTRIGIEAFYGCESLTSIYVKASTPAKIEEYYGKCSLGCENATLYVPKGSLEAYKSAIGWNEFKDIQEY